MAQAALVKTVEADSPDYFSGLRQRTPESGTVCAFTGAVDVPQGIAGRLARMFSALRKEREELFPGPLSSDSCWSVLLQLYAAHVDQHRLYITTLTERAGVPGTTVLRALDALIAAGLVTRSEDRLDRRRVVVGMSEAGVAAMTSYLLKTGPRAAFL